MFTFPLEIKRHLLLAQTHSRTNTITINTVLGDNPRDSKLTQKIFRLPVYIDHMHVVEADYDEVWDHRHNRFLSKEEARENYFNDCGTYPDSQFAK